MSLDERLRAGLRDSTAGCDLDADDMFDRVVGTHRRDRLRARVVRQATAIAVVLTMFVGVAFFVSWRNTSARYRSVAIVGLGELGSGQSDQTAFKLGDPAQAAMAPATRRATLLAAHLPSDDPNVDFRAANTGTHTLSLTATAPTPQESATVANQWVSVLAKARKIAARQQLIKSRHDLAREVAGLRQQLQTVDAKLAKLDPKIYGSAWKYDGSPLTSRPHPPSSAPPPVPEQGSVKELNLAFERIQLRSRLEPLWRYATAMRFTALTPDVLTRPISQQRPTRVDAAPSATWPALTLWIAGLALILAIAVIVYRRRARPLRV